MVEKTTPVFLPNSLALVLMTFFLKNNEKKFKINPKNNPKQKSFLPSTYNTDLIDSKDNLDFNFSTIEGVIVGEVSCSTDSIFWTFSSFSLRISLMSNYYLSSVYTITSSFFSEIKSLLEECSDDSNAKGSLIFMRII